MKQIINKEDKAVSPIIATIIDGAGDVVVVSALFVEVSFNMIDVTTTFSKLPYVVDEAPLVTVRLFVREIDVVGERYLDPPDDIE